MIMPKDMQDDGADGKKPALLKQPTQKQVFADAEAMKHKARQALIRPQYNVFDYYYHTGCCQLIAKSAMFENSTLIVIFVNALWIAVDIDYNDSHVLVYSSPVFVVMENVFCTYFTLELLIRFMAFREKKYWQGSVVYV